MLPQLGLIMFAYHSLHVGNVEAGVIDLSLISPSGVIHVLGVTGAHPMSMSTAKVEPMSPVASSHFRRPGVAIFGTLERQAFRISSWNVGSAARHAASHYLIGSIRKLTAGSG
jgi:hypothetical protein